MQHIERSKLITYRWWREKGNINPTHIKMLDYQANDHISDMQKKGITSGELNTTLYVGNKGVYYKGWWDVSDQ